MYNFHTHFIGRCCLYKRMGGALSTVPFFLKCGKILHGVAATPLESDVSRISKWWIATWVTCAGLQHRRPTRHACSSRITKKRFKWFLPCLTSSFRYRSVEFFALNDSHEQEMIWLKLWGKKERQNKEMVTSSQFSWKWRVCGKEHLGENSTSTEPWGYGSLKGHSDLQ